MNDDWYDSLEKPFLTPPDWIFGPVWTLLYIMITVSIVLFIVKQENKKNWQVYFLIAGHLLSNFIWTPLFFALQTPALALIDIIILDITLVLMIIIFWKTSRLASILLWPYLCWVSFATYLNTAFVILN